MLGWIVGLSFLGVFNLARAYTISINFQEDRKEWTTAELALKDFKSLLKEACNCEVLDNQDSADIIFQLPKLSSITDLYFLSDLQEKEYPLYDYPDHEFTWKCIASDEQLIFELTTANEIGLANALYAFLQEQLNFSFYHPRESNIPSLTNWSDLDFKEWKASPRFTIKGFHLHTQHPLELTEPLHDPNFPNGEEMIKAYIDWLARNGQNYFEFNLLESVELKEWIPYMKNLVNYMHQRGVVAGVDLSLHMIQQKSFMLYKSMPVSFRSKKNQIKRNVELLAQVGFDVWNMEFATAEFVQGDLEKKTELRLFLIDLLLEKNIRLMGREHVVKLEESVGTQKEVTALTEDQYNIDKYRGVLIHTVMFYTIFEDKAPVYENENLRRMLKMMWHEQMLRETWYYPESAYWITFDNSVPLLLLPYFSARLADIELMEEMNIPGHVTFSSGWEWGYWAIDWSIAQWSWKHTIDGREMGNSALEYLHSVEINEKLLEHLETSLSLQESYLKDEQLMKYLTAQTATDELPGPLNIEFHPRPPWSYKYLLNDAPVDTINKVLDVTIPALLDFVNEYDKSRLDESFMYADLSRIEKEVLDGTDMVRNRAEHRAHTLQAICEIRKMNLENKKIDLHDLESLKKAKEIRNRSLEIVSNREQDYRYDLRLLAGEYLSHTAYNFGYLFPVHNLHFWNREEQQIIQNKWSARFMNIWDLLRIIGLKN